MRSIIDALALVMFVGIGQPSIALTQIPSSAYRRVTIIEAESALTPGTAIVYRRASGPDRDVIALSAAATGEDLTQALRVLAVLHETLGDSVGRDIAAAARVETDRVPAARTPRDRAKLHTAFRSKLRTSNLRRVAGFGTVRALDIDVLRSPNERAAAARQSAQKPRL